MFPDVFQGTTESMHFVSLQKYDFGSDTPSYHIIKYKNPYDTNKPLKWRHNGHDGVPNHQPRECLLSHLMITENITAPRHWPLCGELTGDRWIPRTNGQ